MDVNIQVDDLIVGDDRSGRGDAVSASLSRALEDVLDPEAAGAVGRAVTEAISGAVPGWSADPDAPP